MLEAQTITGDRVSLRPISTEDTDAIVRWRNSEGVRPFFLMDEPLTVEMHRQWLATKVATGKAVQFIISDKESNQDIGSVYLRDIDTESGQAEFGIYLGEEEVRGRGFGREASSLILAYAWKTLGLGRVYLRVRSDNSAALRCYTNIGFLPMAEKQPPDDTSVCDDVDVVFMQVLNPGVGK